MIWFNEGLANVYDALRLIREADPGHRLRLLASHQRASAPALVLADASWLEPRHITESEYIDWCLARCREHGVDLFVPGRFRRAIATALPAFAALGTRVLLAGDARTLDLLEHKDTFYADVAAAGIAVPAHRVFSTVPQFDAAWAELHPRYRRLCIKPAVSVFGAGFHELCSKRSDAEHFKQIMSSAPNPPLPVDAFRRALQVAPRPRALLLMQFLPGLERSVDCLAQDGELVAAVARRKQSDHQVLETKGPAVDIAAALTRRLGLRGLFNVQTRDVDGTPHVLEINGRMSGGLLYACLSGVCFPYWAVMLALGLARPADVPRPRGGIAVAPVTHAVGVGRAGARRGGAQSDSYVASPPRTP